MRWRRVVLFAAIVFVHLLVVRFFPTGPARRDTVEEISFATLMIPESTRQDTAQAKQQMQTAVAALRRHTASARAASHAEPSHPNLNPVPANEIQPGASPSASPSIDWAMQAQIVAGSSVRQGTEALPGVGSLLRRSGAVSSSSGSEAAQFRWDHAQTHRLESSALGLNVNLDDRCSVLISLYWMAITGDCKVGEQPPHADLFARIKRVPEATVPASR
jgi:hypothetical protein